MMSHMAEIKVATLMAHTAAVFFKEEKSIILRTWAMKRHYMALCNPKKLA